MNQPLFKHTSNTPPATYQPVGASYRPIHTYPFTPQEKTHPFFNPRPEMMQFKPASQLNFRGQQAQSTIFPNQAPQADQNRTLTLESYARKVSFQEQNNLSSEARNGPAARLNHSIERALDVRQMPAQFVPGYPLKKSPLFASSMLTNQPFRSDLNTKLQQQNEIKVPLHFPMREEGRGSEVRGEMRLSLNNREVEARRKESHTDRQPFPKDRTNNYLNFIGNNLKYRQFPPNEQSNKNNATLLDSTQSSQTQSLNLKDEVKETIEPPKDTSSFIPKNPSPINFWPLSISPYEEKKVVLPMPAGVAPPEKKEGKELTDQCTQFKKKKPLEFLNQSKRRNAESPAKIFTINDFQLLDKIGKGSFGDVYLAQDRQTGFLVVLKKLLKRKISEMKMQEHLLREIKIQSFLKHRHLTSFYGFFCDETYVYLILEAMPDGSLMQVKKKRKISECQTAIYIRQICEGLKYMHTEEIIHRDIKPENIFLNDGYAKIGDFGCSIYTQSLRNTIIGSLAYISPEQLKQGSYDEKIDVWSLGVMAYEMMVGKSPYEADIIKIAKNEIAPQLSQLKFPPQLQLSPEAKDFLVKMLRLDPNSRIGIADALRHDFIKINLAKEENFCH